MSATLIYDGDCPLCCAAIDWVKRHAVPGAFDYITCQSDERAIRFPKIPLERCMEAMHLVYDTGDYFAGDAALPHICLNLRRWRWVAKILRVPPFSTFSPYVYRFIARNRQTFSILVARKAPDSCPTESRE